MKQFNDLVKMFDHTSEPWLMQTAFPKAVQAWSSMTKRDRGKDYCGFWNDFRFGETGFVMTCDNSDFCKKERTNLFKAIAVFEPFVGELKNLPDGF